MTTYLDTRAGEACNEPGWPGWDTVWSTAINSGDWAVAGPVAGNAGGLRAADPLGTAVVLCLFTDRRCPPDHPLAKYVDPADPRGWWGDAVDVRADLGETELGSLWWLLERAPLLPEIERWAGAMAEEALSPLIRAKVAARLEVEVERRADDHGLNAWIRLYDRDGSLIHDGRYDFAWADIAG